MSIFTMLADPKVLLLLLVLSAVGIFIYYYLRKTTDGINNLERKQNSLQRQLVHGIVVEDEKDKHKLYITENQSEDGTLDCSYKEEQRPTIESDTLSHKQLQQLQREHEQEDSDETDTAILHSEGSESSDESENHIWKQQAINDLHNLKQTNDFKLIGNIPNKEHISYTNDEEDIIFNELDEEDDYVTPMLTRNHPLQQQVLKPMLNTVEKILEDIKTIDKLW